MQLPCTYLTIQSKNTTLFLCKAHRGMACGYQNSPPGTVRPRKGATVPMLPARFGHPWDIAAQTQEPKTNSAHTKASQEASHPATNGASIVPTNRKFWFRSSLNPQRLSCHRSLSLAQDHYYARNGIPRYLRSALASSFVLAVVTIVISMP